VNASFVDTTAQLACLTLTKEILFNAKLVLMDLFRLQITGVLLNVKMLVSMIKMEPVWRNAIIISEQILITTASSALLNIATNANSLIEKDGTLYMKNATLVMLTIIFKTILTH
jgi:hypothetical protein